MRPRRLIGIISREKLGWGDINAPIKYRKHLEYLNNLTQSRLCQLPTELILHIGSYITPTDLLSLEASCRHFRIMLQWETKKGFHLCDRRKELLRMLEKDRFPHTALAETIALMGTNRSSDIKTLLCSHCHSAHPSSLFEPNATLESSYRRVCRGVSGVIPICNHRLITFAEIQVAMNRGTKRLCRHPSHHSVYPVLIPTHITMFLPPIRQMWILISSTILELPDWDFSQFDRLHASLVSLDAYICPHLRSSSPLVFQLLQEPFLRPNHRGPPRLVPRPDPADPSRKRMIATPWADCPENNCKAHFTLECLGRPEVPLNVTRSLGNVLKPTTEVWLAQVEELGKLLPKYIPSDDKVIP